MRLVFLATLGSLAMVAFAVPVAENTGIRIPLTKRSNLVDKDGVVNIQVLRNQVLRTRNKVTRGLTAFERNTGRIHPNDFRRSNTTKRATGSESLTDDQGVLWQGAITIGTPAKTFTVDFDTGSSDLFLPASNCNVNCAGHTLWTTSASSTAQNLGSSFSLAFGDGSTVAGTIFQDTVSVAGISVTGQDVGAATRYSTGFSKANFPPDGLMGMGFPAISVFRADPFFHTAVAQGKTTASEFAFKLATTGSELFLGGVNNNLFTGSFTQNQVTTAAFWQISLDSVGVNGASRVAGGQAIVDTGTTMLLGPADAVAQVYAAIPGARDASNTVGPGFFTLPCATIPTVSLTFGGRTFSISPSIFNLGRLSLLSFTCVGGLGAVDFADMWIVGDVFLENVYTSFNTETQQVGFATLA